MRNAIFFLAVVLLVCSALAMANGFGGVEMLFCFVAAAFLTIFSLE